MASQFFLAKWQNLGCYRDNSNRAFKGGFRQFPRATVIDDCRSLAVSRHHQYFGVESGDQCFTGNNIENVQRYGLDRDCNDGRGGSWKLSVYRDVQSVSVQTITLKYRDDKDTWEDEDPPKFPDWDPAYYGAHHLLHGK